MQENNFVVELVITQGLKVTKKNFNVVIEVEDCYVDRKIDRVNEVLDWINQDMENSLPQCKLEAVSGTRIEGSMTIRKDDDIDSRVNYLIALIESV